MSDGALHALEAALETHGCRRGSSGMWTCPAHDDRTPSLCVRQGEEGAVLKCHAGCETKDIVEVLEMKVSDLFDAPRKTNGNGRIARSGFGGGPAADRVAEYVYTDRAGQPLARKVRTEPKGFFWEVLDGGSWRRARTGEGNPGVLFRLSCLLRAEVKVVHVCEGEKGATALNVWFARHDQADQSATCTPTGKLTAEMIEALVGKRVVLWADRDEPGLKKATEFFDQLGQAGMEVKVVQSVVSEEHADAFDHLEAGHAPEAALPVTLRSFPQAITLAEFLEQPEPKIDFIVEPWLGSGSCSGMFSKPWAGKTALLRGLAIAVSEGKEWLGCTARPGLVLYYAADDPHKRTRKGFQKLRSERRDQIRLVFAGQEELFWTEARRLRPVLVIVETLQKLFDIKNINDYSEIVPLVGRLQTLADETAAHIIFSHHAKKKNSENIDWDDILGSVGLRGNIDAMFLLREIDGVHTISAKFRDLDQDLAETTFTLDETGWPLLGESRKAHVQGIRREEILRFLREKDEPLEFDAVAQAVEGSHNAIRASLNELVDVNLVERNGAGKRGSPYCYRAAP